MACEFESRSGYPHAAHLPFRPHLTDDGDWTQHQSAIVEDLSGALRVVTWRDLILQADRAALCEELSDSDSGPDARRSLDS